jgi:prepilin-type N-terminal cleavage/methylation domain-containing protein
MFKKLFKAEGGFTLVELLVTVAILGVLFGIVTLTLSGVGAGAEDSVEIAECAVVQSAADIWLAASAGNTITARGSAAVVAATDLDAQFKGYLRDLPTQYTYSWTAAGDVSCPDVITGPNP